jgi:hypothetical protein
MVACFKQGLYWQGIVHDLSKLRPSEFFPYADYFYGNKPNDRDKNQYRKSTTTSDEKMDIAWLYHLRKNRHHWQWWMLPEDDGGVKLIEMPYPYLVEMLCDWNGAGKAIGRKFSDYRWWKENEDKIQLHSITKANVEEILKWYGIPIRERKDIPYE